LDAIFESCRLHLLKADGRIPEAGSLTRYSAAGKLTQLHRKMHIQQNMAGLGGTQSPAGRAGSTQRDDGR